MNSTMELIANLTFASSTNTNSLTLFFVRMLACLRSPLAHLVCSCVQSDSSEGEQSRVFYVGFKGVTNDVKKEQTGGIETPAANSADATTEAREKRANKQSRIQ